MSNTLAQNGAANAAKTTNSLYNDLVKYGMVINHSNRDLINELFGDRIVCETPPQDVLLPNGFSLMSWSMSNRNIVPKILKPLGSDIVKAADMAQAIIQSFIPYAPYIRCDKNDKGEIVNITLSFKSTSDMNRMAMVETLRNSDLTDIKKIMNISNEKYYSFEERAYFKLDGTRIPNE